jgi:Ca2+-binding RTX toxin-like protein
MGVTSARWPCAAAAVVVVLVGMLLAAAPAPAARRACWGRKPTIIARPKQHVIKGTKGNDVILGSRGRDVLVGRDGEDRICGRGGRDTVRAGRGNDIVSGGASGDHLRGGAGADDLAGGRGTDSLKGDSGSSDYLAGGPGKDRLNGGGGSFDAVAYSSAPRAVEVNLQTGAASGRGRDVLGRVEDIVGSDYDDTLVGNASPDGNGFVGGPGNDSIDGGGGPFDIVFHTTATGPVTVDLNNGSTSGDGTDTDDLVDIEDAQGTRFDDTLIGSGKGNFLWGRGGLDALDGKAGNDVLEATSGNDSIDGGAGFDYVSYIRSSRRTTVDLGTGKGIVSDVEADALTDVEGAYGSQRKDVMRGSGEENELFGLAGSDRLYGLDGDDLLDGDFGRAVYRGEDTLNGGNDNDTCVNGESVSHCESAGRRRPVPNHRTPPCGARAVVRAGTPNNRLRADPIATPRAAPPITSRGRWAPTYIRPRQTRAAPAHARTRPRVPR